MKEINKKSILAAFALAMMLGVAVPSTGVFASEGTPADDTSESAGKNEEDSAGDKTEEATLSKSYVLSLAELYIRVNNGDAFKAYRGALPVLRAANDLERYGKGAYAVIAAADKTPSNEKSWYAQLADATKDAINNKAFYSVIEDLKKDTLYTGNTEFKAFVDEAVAETDADKLAISNYLGSLEGVKQADIDKLTTSELLTAVKAVPSFAIYNNLYQAGNAIGDIKGLVFEESMESMGGQPSSDFIAHSIDVKSLETAYKSDPNTVITVYQNYAKAAVAVDKDALKDLVPIELPNTSVPDAPGAGILSMIENGSIDMGMVAIIVMAAVAVLLGTGFVAKLYLKHKF